MAFWCDHDELAFSRVDGIWSFLRPGREDHFRRFIQEYEFIRSREGRGSDEAEYYRSLPYLDKSWPLGDQWAIRAKSFDSFIKKVVEPMEGIRKRGLKVLDMGAGNGWLSYRMAMRNHAVAAVDLTTNSFDGLGTHRFYAARFIPVRSEFIYLPFDEDQFDLVVFNASFHYAESYKKVLTEVLRVLISEGTIVILDSPVYRNEDSGRQMVREREAQFERKYGFPSNSLQSENYLTYQRLRQLEEGLPIEWIISEPYYGLRWKLRSLKAFLLGTREPAKFALIEGVRRD